MNKNKKGILLALCLVLAVPGMRQRSSRAGYQHVFHYVRQHPGETGSDQSGTKERETMKSNLSNLEQIKKDLETKKK